MENKEIKVTDRRMFTDDGELREEYRFLDESAASEEGPSQKGQDRGEPAPDTHPSTPSEAPESRSAPPPSASTGSPPQQDATPPRSNEPSPGPLPRSPSFFDLVTLLAEPIPIFLGDMTMPDGSSAENLDMARLHIDLLSLLQQKTTGNLTEQESAVLQDVLYRLRLRYVEKRG